MMFKWHKNIQNRQNLQSIISRKNFGILLILFLTLNMLFYSNNIFGLNLGGFLTNTGDVQALKDAATSSNRTVGEYDLRYGNIEVSEEEGYEFKVSFKDSSNVSQVEYFTTNQAITIYQSNGESSTTSNAVNLNTDRVDVILGKTGSPINTTNSINCNGVAESENSIRLILADGVTNTVQGLSSSAAIDIKNGTDLTILTEQQFADPSHSGNYEGMGTLVAKGGTWTAGIGGGDNSSHTIGNITISGGKVKATCGSSWGSAIGGGYSSQTIGSITINGGTVTAEAKEGAGIGGGYGTISETVNINISGDAKVLAVGSYSGIGKGRGSGSYTVGISDTASVLAIVKSTSYQPINNAELSGTAPAMIGGYLRTASNHINSGDTINIMEENGSICDTFNIPIGITSASRMSFTTGGSTGTKYIQVVRNGAQMLASKTDAVSTLANYQYDSVQTITPNVNELYLVPLIPAPTSSDTVLALGNTATLTEGQINNLWEKTANSITTWNESGGLFSNNHNLGTGNSVTITPLGVEGSTEITTTVSEMRLIGTNLVYQFTSPALTMTVSIGKYDLSYGNIEVSEEEGYDFKVNFTDENGVNRVEYFESGRTITIYQSDGENSTTSNTINLNTDRLDVVLGKTGSPINTTNSINCNGVAGSENSIRLILPDGITNKISGQLDSSGINVTNDSSLTILTEQQFADPSYSGNYEGMGTLISTGGSNGSGIGSENNNSDGEIQINGGSIIAIGGSSNKSAILINSISINNNSKLLAIGNNTPIAATAADTAPAMIGGYLKTDSNYVNSGDTISIIESDGSMLNTFEIPADISITANTRMAFTTAGSTGTKYIQAVRNGTQMLASKVSSVSTLANYQYNSARTLTPDMNDLYLVPAVTIDAPSISTGNTEINSGDTVTFNAAEAQISNLWEAVGDITWNDSKGLFSRSYNLGTGNSVTTTPLTGLFGATEISTNAEIRLVGTNVTISAKSLGLSVTVRGGGEYDLRYGNITVSEEEGYEFKVSFKDSSNVSQVEKFTTNQAITIYQSNGESSTTSNAVNLNTDRADIILGKTGSPINTTNSIYCNGVAGSENNIRLILADGVTNTVQGSAISDAAIDIKNGTDLIILTEQQLADPQHSGNYEGMGTLIARGDTSVAGIGCGNDRYQTTGDITINGGTVTATGDTWSAGIGGGNGSYQTIGNITINGGIVTATEGYVGIGGGNGSYKTIGDITITGGTVTATGSREAGIGGGDSNNQTIGNITITGGTVTAKGGNSGAGIGGGYGSVSNTININVSGTAKVLAVGSYSGIGKGYAYANGTYTVGIADTASVVAIGSSSINAELSGTAPAMIGGYLRTASNYVNSGDTINIMESDGTIIHTFEIPTSIATYSQMAITTAGSTGTKYIQAVRDGATILASKTSSVSNLANYQYNSSETISPDMNELYLVSVIAAPTISNAVLGLNDTATLTMGDTSNTSLWETTENSVITWNDSEGLFNSQHNLGEGDSITVTAQGTEGNTKITATISEMQLVGTNIKSNVSSNSLQVAVTDGEYDLYYGDISITKQDNNTFKLAYRDENNTSKILYLPNDYTITVYQSNGENTSTTNVINVGGTSYSSTVGTSAVPIKLILGKPGSPVNIAATSTATKPCLAVMGDSYLKLILPDNVVNILNNSYGNGEGLTSSTRYPSSAIRVAKYSSYIAHLEITTPDGSNGTGKLVAKAGYDAAAIGGFANSSSVGYGGGYITINSGIVEARTTTAGGAAAIGAGSSGTATSSSYKAVWGNIRINGGEVTAISSLTGDASAIGGGHNSYYSSSTYGSIGISGSAKVLAIGGTSGIGCGNNNENGTVSIADTANVVAISGNSATSPIKASVSGTTPAIVGAYLRSDSNRVNPGDTINIMESDDDICNTFEIPSDISVTEDTRMAITTAGSTGDKYIQVERDEDLKFTAKVASPSSIEDYQYSAERTITPAIEELYLVEGTLPVNTEPIYDVYISWGSHNFTCTRAANGSFSWSQDAGEIGVDNRSNIPIRVRFSYEVDNNSNIHGINGSHEQQELTLARNNEDGHRNNKLNLTGNPFGLYTDGVMEHVGRSILNIERADG